MPGHSSLSPALITKIRGRRGSPADTAAQPREGKAILIPRLSSTVQTAARLPNTHLSQHNDLVTCLRDDTQLRALSLHVREGLSPPKVTVVGTVRTQGCSHRARHAALYSLPSSQLGLGCKQREGGRARTSPRHLLQDNQHTDFHGNSVDYPPPKGA